MPTEVHSRTGFQDVRELLFYVAIVCGGNKNVMMCSHSYLSWFEEWFFYLEMVYGHSAIRWEEYSKRYHISIHVLRRAFKDKLAIVLQSRQQWPMFATNEEDILLRKSSWNDTFDPSKQQRVILHDSTDVRLLKPSDPHLQRALFSRYYASCVAKGGIGLQLCGWTVTFELCTGAMDDTAYVKAVDIFGLQQAFAENDQSSPNPFINIFDRGYRLVLEAQKKGGQWCIQPTYTQNHKKFDTQNVLHSAAVAATRSGNERSVRQVKVSWLIKRGTTYQPALSLETLSDIWLAWGYQINFMYDAVH